jgi:tRNA-specific 2-thiouridylase
MKAGILSENLRGKRVFVGLSGGVDSAVSAALLKEAGAHVTGVFIKGWYPPSMPCTWADDRRDAMRVAAYLGIPFHTLDASTEYKKGVIDYLLSEYAAGRTPNPDIMCNREVKFGAFYTFAREHAVDAIATGHYARAKRAPGEAHTQLLRGIDPTKDQSYFLWAIPQDALDHTIFPIGDLEKSEVRKMALKYSLPVAEKKDSQGICFLGSISVDDFLRNELAPASGIAIDEHGEKVGTHDGAILHTLGQRIALADAAPGPWYVIRKDIRSNTLTVSHELVIQEAQEAIALTRSNWFSSTSGTLSAQYRYHGTRIDGTLDESATIFAPVKSIQEPVAAGQSLVIYRGDECIGGGIIA